LYGTKHKEIAMANDRLRQTIIGTVSMPEVQKINFHCGSRTVNGHIFNLVADRLRKNKIDIDVDPGELDDATEARYLSGDHHTFIFRSPFFGATDSEQAVIVHESVHAGFDVLGDGGHFKRIDNEPQPIWPRVSFCSIPVSLSIKFETFYRSS
jgi:hypothetical protein